MKAVLDNIFGFSELGVLQDRNIPKKSFYEQDAFNTARKKLFTDDIDKLRIIAIFDQNTANIEGFANEDRNYKEIFFIKVELKDATKYKKISEIIHQVIPNPIVIVFTHEKSFLLSVGHKRLSKQEKGKVVMETEYNSIWIKTDDNNKEIEEFTKQLYLKNFNFDNLYSFYSDIIKAIILSNFIELISVYKYSKNSDTNEVAKLADKLKSTQEKMVFHANEDKKIKNFGDKVSNHQKLLDAKKELENIKQSILNLK